MKVSSGCAVIKYYLGVPHILLVVPSGYLRGKKFGIPKGLLEDGEDPLAAAIRETYEETGIKPLVLNKLTEVYNKKKKKVIVYIALYESGELNDKNAINIQKSEIEVAQFIPLKCSEKLIYEYQKPIITSAIDYINKNKEEFMEK